MKEYGKLNNYQKYYELAIKSVGMNKRIDMIFEKIKNASMDNLEEILEKIEECLR